MSGIEKKSSLSDSSDIDNADKKKDHHVKEDEIKSATAGMWSLQPHHLKQSVHGWLNLNEHMNPALPSVNPTNIAVESDADPFIDAQQSSEESDENVGALSSKKHVVFSDSESCSSNPEVEKAPDGHEKALSSGVLSDSSSSNLSFTVPTEEEQNQGSVNRCLVEGADGKLIVAKSTDVDGHISEKRKEYDNVNVEFYTELPPARSGLMDTQVHSLKLPEYVSIEEEVFHPELFYAKMAGQNYRSEQMNKNYLNQLKDTVRWREVCCEQTGKITRQSNAHFVRWSDGSETFHLGETVFDVVHQQLAEGINRIYIQQDNFYAAQCELTGKVTLRPKDPPEAPKSADVASNATNSTKIPTARQYMSNQRTVKMLAEKIPMPTCDRERLIRAELSNLRKQERARRNERYKQQCKSRKNAKPRLTNITRIIAASDPEDMDNENVFSLNEIKRSSGVGTNPNTVVDLYDDDIDDIICEDIVYETESDDLDAKLEECHLSRRKRKKDKGRGAGRDKDRCERRHEARGGGRQREERKRIITFDSDSDHSDEGRNQRKNQKRKARLLAASDDD